MSYVPDRGDIVWLMFDPQADHEQAGRRPALILSRKSYNAKVGLALCCPITNQEKGYPFEIKIPENLDATGVILCDQIKNLDWKVRNAKYICKLPSDELADVMEIIITLLS